MKGSQKKLVFVSAKPQTNSNGRGCIVVKPAGRLRLTAPVGFSEPVAGVRALLRRVGPSPYMHVPSVRMHTSLHQQIPEAG